MRYNRIVLSKLRILPAASGQQAKHLKSYLSDTYAARQTRGGNAWGNIGSNAQGKLLELYATTNPPQQIIYSNYCLSVTYPH